MQGGCHKGPQRRRRGVGVRVGVAGGAETWTSRGNGVRANWTPSNAKRTVASVCTARPFRSAGENRHCIAASTAAASTSARTPFVTLASNGVPVSETRTVSTTSPRMRLRSASSG